MAFDRPAEALAHFTLGFSNFHPRSLVSEAVNIFLGGLGI